MSLKNISAALCCQTKEMKFACGSQNLPILNNINKTIIHHLFVKEIMTICVLINFCLVKLSLASCRPQ